MARGNQREVDRQRAQSRNPKKGSQKNDGLTPEQRRERDAKALQEKAAKKAAQAESGGNAGAKNTKNFKGGVEEIDRGERGEITSLDNLIFT